MSKRIIVGLRVLPAPAKMSIWRRSLSAFRVAMRRPLVPLSITGAVSVVGPLIGAATRLYAIGVVITFALVIVALLETYQANRAFHSGSASWDRDAQIVRNIVGWAASLGLGVVAGVATYSRLQGLVAVRLLLALAAGLGVWSLFGALFWKRFALPRFSEFEEKWLVRTATISVLIGIGAFFSKLWFAKRIPPSQVPFCPLPSSPVQEAADIIGRAAFLLALAGGLLLTAMWAGARIGKRINYLLRRSVTGPQWEARLSKRRLT